MRNLFKRKKEKSQPVHNPGVDAKLPSADSARNKTFTVRRKASDDLERYRFGKMTVKEAIAYRIGLGEFDCTVEVTGKEYDRLRLTCLGSGYNIKLAMMQGTGDDAKITARISW